MSLTSYIAVYGAILSTIAIGWNIYNNLQDRPKVKVTGKFGFMTSSKGAEGHFFFVKAVNKGRRSVHLSSVGLRSGDEDIMIVHRMTGLPHELKEGKSHSEWFTLNELRKLKDENKLPDFAWYRDETGKLYKSKSIKNKLNNYFKSEQNKKEVS